MKILVIILSEKREGYYIKMEEAIRQTWAPKLLEKEEIVDVLYTYGRWDRDLKGDVEKHGALKYVYENYDFDYVFRTNLSAYIHADNLINYIKDKPRENFYNGRQAKHPDKPHITYISGAAFFLSRDLVKLVAENMDKIKFNTIDDIALGEFLHNNEIESTSGPRDSLLTRFKNWPGIKDNSHYHYRVHTIEGQPVHERRLDDALKIKAIHKHFYPEA